jgi:hypothetical protein
MTGFFNGMKLRNSRFVMRRFLASAMMAMFVSSNHAVAAPSKITDWDSLDNVPWQLNIKDRSLGDGKVDSVIARRDDMADLWEGSVTTFVAKHQSEINFYGGEIKHLVGKGESQLNLFSLDGLNRLVVRGAAKVNLYGSNFDYDGRWLSGQWLDGETFRFRFVNHSGRELGSVVNFVQAHVHDVPVPASFWLFTSALVAMGTVARKRQP